MNFSKHMQLMPILSLGMKSTIVMHAMKSMSEEAIHVLLACNQSIHIESLETLNIALNIKPLNFDYILQFPDDPVLSRATPIHIPISHNGIPIDDTLKESFSKLLEESFSTSSPFRFHDLPEALQVIVDDFYAKHITDLSNITIDKITFLTSLPLTGRKEMDVKLPKDEITCRRLATILPTSHQWLIDRLVIEADVLLEAWLNEHSGPDLLFLFNAHFYNHKDDLILHAHRLAVLSKFMNHLTVKDDLSQ